MREKIGMMSLDECRHATRRLALADSDDLGITDDGDAVHVAAVSVELPVVRVSDGEGAFVVTAELPSGDPQPTVDLVPGAMRIRSGRMSRWIPLPEDVMLDRAVIQRNDETLIMMIPEKERRMRRHLVYAW